MREKASTMGTNGSGQTGSKRGLFPLFLSYYAGQVHLFVADLVCAFAIAGIDLAFPQILRRLTQGLFTQEPSAIEAALVYLALGLVAMYAIRFACRYFVIFWGHVMGARMESRMRQDLFDAYERMSIAYFDRNKTGDLMSRLVNDLFDISEAAHHGPEFILIGIIEIVGSFVILGRISWQLTAAMAVVLAVVVAYNVYANWRMRAVYAENRVRIAGVNAQLEDALAGVRVTRGFTAEDLERRKFAHRNEAYLDSKTRMYQAMGRYQAAIAALMGTLYTVIVVGGGWLVAHDMLEVADLATFALYISLFTSPIENILNFTETFQKAFAGFARFAEVLHTPSDVQNAPGAHPLEVREGAISYRDVCFAYPDEPEAPVIDHMNLEVPAGKTVALVGPSGGGKSTTCALLPRFYDVTGGSIQIDGQDVREVTQQSLRQAIGLVQQDVYLFDGSIAENIAYGRPDATAAEIAEAGRRARVDEFAADLPEGYETQVGERGTRLSGGQKQRIAIARVFLKDPAILILDEATSALDNESEQAVQESLAELAAGRTTLVIAHRLSTIRDADEIATVEAGRVVECGTHEELLARGGTYARYYRMQFGE